MKLELTTPGDRKIVIRRSFAAPPELVFDCYTVPALIRRWLFGPPGWTMTVCEVSPTEGGGYRYVWRHDDGRTMGMTGTFRGVQRPSQLVSTEVFDEDWTGGETVVTLDLVPQGSGTALTQTMLYSSREAREGAAFSGMADGMDAGFDRLDTVLAELSE